MPALTKPEKLTQTDSHCSLEGVGVLTELGLSERQARVYLALLKAGSGGARIVAGLAGVPRQESYGLLTQLQRLGLARQNLTVPASYTATPFIEAARLLLERKTQELTAITLRANQITSNLNQNQPTQPITAPTTPKTSFGEIIEGEDGKHYQTAIEQTQVSVWVISSWTRFRHFSYRFETQFKAALKRDVLLWFVAEKPPSHSLPTWINPSLPKYKFKLKTTPNPPDAAIAIFDGTQAAIAYDKNACITRGIDLWTTHPALVAMSEAYFFRVWGSIRG
jgi:sugar-specific transcriptional regulator TrmB